MRLPAFLVAILLSTAALAQGHPEVERLRAEALRIPNVEVKELDGFTLVIEPPGRVIRYFTRPGHFAHPGVVTRTLTQDADGAWYVRTESKSFGTTEQQPEFQRWLAQFRELDRRIREDIYRNNSRQ